MKKMMTTRSVPLQMPEVTRRVISLIALSLFPSRVGDGAGLHLGKQVNLPNKVGRDAQVSPSRVKCGAVEGSTNN